jgi:hypothetical protein
MHVPNVTIPIWDRARALDEGRCARAKLIRDS